MFTSRLLNARILFLMLAALSVVALAACGSDEGGDDPTATSSSNSATPTSGSGSNDPTPTTDSDVGNFYENACDAINLVTGIPGYTQGVSTSDSPQSDTTLNLSNYFESIISDSLGDATPACYVEVMEGETYGVWVSYQLQNDPPSDAVDRMEGALVESGVNPDDIQTFSASSGGQSYSSVVVTGIDVLGEYSTSDVIFYVSGRSIVLAADLREGDSTDPTPGATTGSGSNTPEPVATNTPAPTVGASGAAGQVDSLMRAQLEEQLGVTLSLTGEFNATSSGVTSVSLIYSYEGEISDPQNALTAALEGLGASVDTTFSSGETASAYFTGLAVDGRTGAGTVGTDGTSVSVYLAIE